MKSLTKYTKHLPKYSDIRSFPKYSDIRPLISGACKEFLFKNYSTKIIERTESLTDNVYNKQIETYKKFYNNQGDITDSHEIIKKIINDLDLRLESTKNNDDIFSVMKDLRTEAGLFLESTQTQENYYKFVLKYVEAIYFVFKKHDYDLSGSYFTQFAKDYVEKFYNFRPNARMFFTYKDLDMDYLVNVRPTCFYPIQLSEIPQFSAKVLASLKEHDQPLVQTEKLLKKVEGKMIDFKEMSFHDVGHSCVMYRQDVWLFLTLNRNPELLVEEWINNKNDYMMRASVQLHDNEQLLKAVKLYLFDLVHDRGYQFYLPILRQQIRAEKNYENLRSKISRGDFNDHADQSTLDNLESAREWLINTTNDLLVIDNLKKINEYKNNGYIIKCYPDVENDNGKPVNIIINKNGDIRVAMQCINGEIKIASLFEIELLTVNPEKIVLTNEKIEQLNKLIQKLNMSNNNTISLDFSKIIGSNISNSNIIDSNNDEHFNKDFNLKSIEIYKLERIIEIYKKNKSVKFSVTVLPEIFETDFVTVDSKNKTIRTTENISFNLNEVSVECGRSSRSKILENTKYINLNPMSRFVSKNSIRDSYLIKPDSLNKFKNPYVELENGLELGIVDTKNNLELSTAISSVLTRSIEDAKDIHGGYLPTNVVSFAQKEYVSPYAISNLWGREGYRFVLSKKISEYVREIIGTALISSSKDTLFFFTSKYNNIRHPIGKNIDFNLEHNDHKWFDKFDMPDIDSYKPIGLNQLANFAVEKSGHRGKGLGKLMINEIVKNYAVHNSTSRINHSQPLICGKGLFQIADPSWLKYMLNVGFKLRLGAETFFVDQPWDPLAQVVHNGKPVDYVKFNKMYGLPEIYKDLKTNNVDDDSSIHLIDRIPKVIRLSQSDKHKLQYFQLVLMFNNHCAHVFR